MKESEYITYADALKITQSEAFYGTLLQLDIRQKIFRDIYLKQKGDIYIADTLNALNIKTSMTDAFNARNTTLLLSDLITSLEMIDAYSRKELFIHDSTKCTVPYVDKLLVDEDLEVLKQLPMTYQVPLDSHYYIPKAGTLEHLSRRQIARDIFSCITPLNLTPNSREIQYILGNIVGASTTQCLATAALGETGGRTDIASSYHLS